MSKIGNKHHKEGAAQPGIERSDECPWGIKDINMPIPIYFARNLRNNTNGLQDEYRKFIANRIYRLLPLFINRNEHIVFNRVGHATNNNDVIRLVKWDTASNMQYLGNGDMIGLLTKKDKYRRLVDIHGFDLLPYVPNILDNLSSVEKIEIINQIQYPCWFTDNKYVAAIIVAESTAKIGMFDATNAINAYNSGNFGLLDQLLNDQLVTFTFEDNQLEPVSVDDPSYKQYMSTYLIKHFCGLTIEYEKNNRRILDNLIHGRNIINISYVINTPCAKASHAVSVIVDTIKKLIYILDSNGVGICEQNIYYYFKKQLNWRDDEYVIVPISPYKYYETPRAFQAISRGDFCQTWNIFNRELVMLNDVGVDINKTIYEEILSHADPIIGDVNGMTTQVKITLIMLEFMFYIFSCCKDDFFTWVSGIDDPEEYSSYYEHTDFDRQQESIVLSQILTRLSKQYDITSSLVYFKAKNEAETFTYIRLRDQFKCDRESIANVGYNINPDTSEYISKFYPEYEDTKNLSTDHFLDNALKTFL